MRHAPAQDPPNAWTRRVVTLEPKTAGIHIWTNALYDRVPELRDAAAGVVNLFVSSGSHALTINENADPDVRSDLANALAHIVPSHPAARAALVGASLDVPVLGGRLALGTWQGLYLIAPEPGPVRVVVTLVRTAVRGDRQRTWSLPAYPRGCHLVPPDTFCEFLAPREERDEPVGTPNNALLFSLLQHTSASLTVNENADPDVRSDLSAALDRIAPEAWNRPNASGVVFAHVDEGDDDMPAHVKATLCGPGLVLPLAPDPLGKGGFAADAGTWQGPYLCEHRNAGGARRVASAAVVATRGGRATVALPGRGRGCHEVTAEIEAAVRSLWGDDGGDDEDDADASRADADDASVGWANVFLRHTSASLVAASRDGGERLAPALDAVAPERWHAELFAHTLEGPDDMCGHVKSTLAGVSVTVPVRDGRLVLGGGEAGGGEDEAVGLWLCEHRNGRFRREVTVTVQRA